MDRNAAFDAMQTAVQSGLACVLYSFALATGTSAGVPVETLPALYAAIAGCLQKDHVVVAVASLDGDGPRFVFCHEVTAQTVAILQQSYATHIAGLSAAIDKGIFVTERIH